VAYTITEGVLFDMRGVLGWAERQIVGAAEPSSFGLTLKRIRGALDHADGLDSERLHELATWAREQARAKSKMARSGDTLRADAAPGSNLIVDSLCCTLAETSRVIEISTDVLTALALDKLPPGAVLNIGRDEQQVNAKPALDVLDPGPAHLRWPDADERAFMGRMAAMVAQATSGEPDPGEAMFMRIGANLGLEVELAANGRMSRAEVEALPSHDRVVLGQILATLRGEPITREPLDGPAVDVLVELDQVLRALQDEQDADLDGMVKERDSWEAECTAILRLLDWQGEWTSGTPKPRRLAAELLATLTHSAPRYSLPESHPLRQYQWAEWLHGTLEALRVEVARGFFVDVDGRAEWLEAALGRINALDVHGLRGLVEAAHDKCEDSPLSIDENTLLLFACDRMGFDSIHVTNSFVSAGCHRVPRVRGETVEVGS
jgi:hypothetical protein